MGNSFYTYANNNPVNGNDPSGQAPGDIYGVTPATRGLSQIISTNLDLLGQRALGSWGTGYSHAAIEINPTANNVAQIAQELPNGGLQITPMSTFMNAATSRGSTVDRYAPNTLATTQQLTDITANATANQGAPYNWFLAFTDRSAGKYTCADYCDAAAQAAKMAGINNLADYGISPLPSDLSLSPNYSKQPLDYPRTGGASGSWGTGATGTWDDTSASSAAAGGYLLYPNMPNNNGAQAVYSKGH